MTALAQPQILRNADLTDLSDLLKAQADLRYDVVVSADKLSYRDGTFVLDGGAVRFDDGGAQSVDAILRPTPVCEEHVAARFDIPVRYLRRIREEGLRSGHDSALLLDETVNAHLAANPGRTFLLRGLRTDDPDAEGVARALLSDRYKVIDHLDALFAALKGVRNAGVEVNIDGCDLSERRMFVRISAPEIAVHAERLFGNYRSPFGDGGLHRFHDRGLGAVNGRPVVHAGVVISNSETGGGALSVTPRIVLESCSNGATVTRDVVRAVHVGGKLEEGLIRWSEGTQEKEIELITAKTTDAVQAFLSTEYVEKVLASIEEKADTKVTEPIKVLERVGKQFNFSQQEQDTILSAFITSGDVSAGGVLNAVTAAAQVVADPDRAADLESVALDVLDFVAAN